MQTITPRELYDQDDLGIGDRLPLYAGLFFGLGMLLFSLVPDLLAGVPVGRALTYALFVGVVGGVLFGLLFPWILQRMARRFHDRLYAGDPALVLPPPVGEYEYRVPCGWIRSPRNAIGGVLYVGRRGLRFEAHLRNPRLFRHALVAEPLESVRVRVDEVPLPMFARIWGRRSVPRIVVEWQESSAVFGIPRAHEVAERLRECIERLRQGGQRDGHVHSPAAPS